MANVQISADDVLNYANRLKTSENQIQTVFQEVDAKMNYLNGIWTSPASASLISQFQSLRPVFHSYLQAIETYVQFLQQTAASYQENEQQLASRIQ